MNTRILATGLVLALLGACGPTHGPSVSTSGAEKVYHSVGAKGEDPRSNTESPSYDAWEDPNSEDRAELKQSLARGEHPNPNNPAYGGWKSSVARSFR